MVRGGVLSQHHLFTRAGQVVRGLDSGLDSALDAFADHFPSSGVAKVSKQVKHLRSGAGRVRDHDIALMLAAEIGLELSEKAGARIECDQPCGGTDA